MLVEKLILELKRIKRDNPSVALQLEDDVRLIFFSEFDSANLSLDTELSHKLKSFADTVNRKFESLGPWSQEHQLMLNSFLQERFLMANVVKSANAEIEKTRNSTISSIDSLRRTEAALESYRGLFGKLRTSMAGIGGFEVESVLTAIFREFDTINSGNEVLSRDLGSLSVTDARVSSLLREKDAELARLRDELTRINKLKSTINNDAAHNRSLSILSDENNKLKNEINQLRVDRGSSELITSYKQQIQTLNARINEL